MTPVLRSPHGVMIILTWAVERSGRNLMVLNFRKLSVQFFGEHKLKNINIDNHLPSSLDYPLYSRTDQAWSTCLADSLAGVNPGP